MVWQLISMIKMTAAVVTEINSTALLGGDLVASSDASGVLTFNDVNGGTITVAEDVTTYVILYCW